MVSPADGKIDLIEEIEHDDVIDGPAIKIAIFLSVFNVHINQYLLLVPCLPRDIARGSSSVH